MNSIYLDIGNSSFKLAGYQKETWVELYKAPLAQFDGLVSRIKEFEGLEELMYCSVRKEFDLRLTESLAPLSITKITNGHIPRQKLDYNTPETLGADRYLACLGAAAQSTNGVIVIDAGSACTVDYMDRDLVFKGGVIMPGIQLLKRSMKKNLPELPEVEFDRNTGFPGKSTKECIQLGLYNSYAAAVLSFIARYRETDAGADVYLTGGDRLLLKQMLPHVQDAGVQEFLVFKGMKVFNETGGLGR